MYRSNFICKEPSLQKDSLLGNVTSFRYFDLDNNYLFRTEEKEYVHLLYLLDGEMKVSGVKTSHEVIRAGEFVFIPASKFICRAIQKSNFILFSINKFHFHPNKEYYYEIIPAISVMKNQNSPFMAPRLLSVFMENMKCYLQKGFDNPAIQEVKRREFFFLLNSLYSKINNNEMPMYGYLSLS